MKVCVTSGKSIKARNQCVNIDPVFDDENHIFARLMDLFSNYFVFANR